MLVHKFETWTLGEIRAAAADGNGYALNYLEELFVTA